MSDKLRTYMKGMSPELLYNRFELSYRSLFAVDLTNVQLLPIGVTISLWCAHCSPIPLEDLKGVRVENLSIDHMVLQV